MDVVWRSISSIFSRMIFVGHAVWCLRETIYRIHVGDVEAAKNSSYWALVILLGFIGLEGIYTLIIRKGHEYKFFWPTGFVYIVIMIPIVCILEVFLLNEELKCLEAEAVTNSTARKALVKYCNLVTLSNKNDQKIRSAVEIGMLGALVIGRWLLPRGELTRDQLSALLLAFISNGADVIEFLNTWNDFPVLRTPTVIYTVLGLYSWSLLQFAVVTTKTTDEYDAENENDEKPNILNGVQFENDNTKEAVIKKISPKNGIPTYDPRLPRYIQKLMKKNLKSKVNKQRLSSKSSFSTSPKPDFLKKSTSQTKEKYTRKNNRPTRSLTTRSSNTKSRPRAHTAQYLQYLAQQEQWETFSAALKKGQDCGFTYDENDNVFTEEGNPPESKQTFLSRFDQDVFQTCILLSSLELPYFCARIAFTIIYDLSSTTMVFYTTKNVIMIIFLIYRLWVILSGRTEEEELKDGELYRDFSTLK